MSQDFTESGLTFSFPDAWTICRPEKSSFYIRHFQNFCGGCKEMDFLAYDAQLKILWFIEVKNYVVDPRTKEIDLIDEVAYKTRDVLAMLPLSLIHDNGISSAGNLQVRDFWSRAREASLFRVVLHCELPAQTSRLFPGVKDSANLQTRLLQKLRCVDPHSIFTQRSLKHNFPWAVV